MLKRQIVGVIGISLWAGLIAVAAVAALGESKPAKETAEEAGSEAEAIEALATDLVGALASGDYERARENFDETMKNVVSVENLKKAWESLIAEVGPFAEQVGTRMEEIQGYDVIFVTCKFEKGILDVKVVFNDQQQVAGLFFVPSQGSAEEKLNK
jgi:hypothetical protein